MYIYIRLCFQLATFHFGWVCPFYGLRTSQWTTCTGSIHVHVHYVEIINYTVHTRIHMQVQYSRFNINGTCTCSYNMKSLTILNANLQSFGGVGPPTHIPVLSARIPFIHHFHVYFYFNTFSVNTHTCTVYGPVNFPFHFSWDI